MSICQRALGLRPRGFTLNGRDGLDVGQFGHNLTIVIALNLHKKIDKAKNSHKIHHQNTTGLRYEFQIPRETEKI